MASAKKIPARDVLLLPFQAPLENDTARQKIMEKSRQIGISWSSAYGLTRRKALSGATLDG